ncbi:LOW QUALITY PROTEIN: disease resistance protein RUN1-like [Cucumis melo]|uniref:LOW QUALITY PROTEIN: disease resistance protein RUN1-like n=2 Tax=Cucumis melo TaxID=3656 RepID=A0A1S3BZ02_CUCME|nr:LOW QUALITY PROTEIN: disease resistance protein RUN1-like [Cucumis melo]
MDSSTVATESPTFKWSYDVFLSFRGEDTRTNFTSHLDMALRQKGVNVFIDDKLERGEQISETLFKSIQEALISIVTFSQNYASSSWCLDELVKIIECKKSKGQIVLPIFYKVDPLDIRKQTGRFREALVKHMPKFQTKTQIWREALTTMANLSGWDLGTRKEADLIGDVKKVLSTLNRTCMSLYVAKFPVGIDSKLEYMKLRSNNLLEKSNKFHNRTQHEHESDTGVYMVGIYGIGGIGKTTLAKALYNKIASQFEGCCFLSNVREASKRFNGLAQLQESLLYEILMDDLKVVNLDRGINIIRNRLHSKKVFIVLDDVDKLEQLEALVGGRDWFGQGSRIIVTTRNKHLLNSHGFDEMHNVRGLNQDKAIELFSWHAFKKCCPSSNCVDLSKRATSYCKGHPLTLVVLGSFLCTRDQGTDTIKTIKLDLPNPTMLNVDSRGFRNLKNMRLLIVRYAIFSSKIEYLPNSLKWIKWHGFAQPSLPSRLIMKNLVGLDLQHSFIKKFGKRLEDCERLKHVDLSYSTLLEKIPDFSAASNLEELYLINCTNLKMIDKSVFSLHKLTILNLDGCSKPKEHPTSYYKLRSLQYLNLSYCKKLEKIPDLSAASNLKSLYLQECTNLRGIHESIGSLDMLVTMDLRRCTNLDPTLGEISREFLLMGTDVPKWFSYKTTTNWMSASFRHYPDMARTLAACVSFKVNGSSSKREYMWLITTSLAWGSMEVQDWNKVLVWFEVVDADDEVKVSIRRCGVHVTEELHGIQTDVKWPVVNYADFYQVEKLQNLDIEDVLVKRFFQELSCLSNSQAMLHAASYDPEAVVDSNIQPMVFPLHLTYNGDTVIRGMEGMGETTVANCLCNKFNWIKGHPYREALDNSTSCFLVRGRKLHYLSYLSPRKHGTNITTHTVSSKSYYITFENLDYREFRNLRAWVKAQRRWIRFDVGSHDFVVNKYHFLNKRVDTSLW